MTVLGAIVDTGALLKVIVGSLLLGIGVTAAFSLSILGATRLAELRRAERPIAAGAFAVLMAAGAIATAAAVVIGIVVMTDK